MQPHSPQQPHRPQQPHEIREERRRLQAKLLREEDKQWVHHVADLERGDRVLTVVGDRPLTTLARFDRVTDLVSVKLRRGSLGLYERRLTPRAPYEQSPLSYLNAMGRSWSLWAEDDRLEWSEDQLDRRYGGMEFWFRNVTAGSTALVTLEVTAAATAPGVTGQLEVRSSDASPRLFPVTGFADHTLDLIVRPSMDFGTLVTIEVKDGVGYFAFREITYSTV
jgi:hypothetical protein